MMQRQKHRTSISTHSSSSAWKRSSVQALKLFLEFAFRSSSYSSSSRRRRSSCCCKAAVISGICVQALGTKLSLVCALRRNKLVPRRCKMIGTQICFRFGSFAASCPTRTTTTIAIATTTNTPREHNLAATVACFLFVRHIPTAAAAAHLTRAASNSRLRAATPRKQN